MASDVNPQLPYYLLLFLLTILLRCIRAYKSRPSANDDPEIKKNYRASFAFFGFELVNVSAGVFILLSEHASKYVGAVMILYVILVIVGFFLEEDGIGRRVKLIGHTVVSLIIFGVTIWSFLAVDGLKPDKQLSQTTAHSEPAIPHWVIALPYVDATLNRNFGVKSTPIQSVYITDSEGRTRSEAVEAAKAIFFSPKGPRPFNGATAKTPVNMIILESVIVAEQTQAQH